MLCPKCHKPSIPDARFCAYCGRNLYPAPRKPKRAPNGAGCVYQRPGQKTWTAQVVVGYRALPPFDPESPENKKQRIPCRDPLIFFISACPIPPPGSRPVRSAP